MGDTLNNNSPRILVTTFCADVDMHNHVASCREEIMSAVERNLNRLRRPIAGVDDDKINQTTFRSAIITSNNFAFMRPKKRHLNERGYETQLEKSV